MVNLPNRVPNMPREQYVNDSAHHGLSIDQAGTTLCAAGTMDDYAALVDRRTMSYKIFDTASTGHYYGKPYWTTEGLDNTCWISLSDADSVAVLDFGKKKELAYLPVGDHPQRIRHGFVATRCSRAADPASGPPRRGRTTCPARCSNRLRSCSTPRSWWARNSTSSSSAARTSNPVQRVDGSGSTRSGRVRGCQVRQT